MQWIGLVLMIIFFITSSDSGSFVDDMVTSGGNPNPVVANRVFLGVSEGGRRRFCCSPMVSKLFRPRRSLPACPKVIADFWVCGVSEGSSPKVSEALEAQGHAVIDNLVHEEPNTKFPSMYNHLLKKPRSLTHKKVRSSR